MVEEHGDGQIQVLQKQTLTYAVINNLGIVALMIIAVM